jgi:co-chaperonin GroES (HSP10)
MKGIAETVEKEAKCFITPVVLPEGRIVIEQDSFHYSGRLAIPDTAKRRPTTGHVVRVSDTVNLGDLLGKRVIFGMYSGTLVTFKNMPAYRILECREVQGIVEIEDIELEVLE